MESLVTFIENYPLLVKATIIILSFILVGEVTGLALIFAAKNLARVKDIRDNAGFFLAGTMVNFTATLVIAYLLKIILAFIP